MGCVSLDIAPLQSIIWTIVGSAIESSSCIVAIPIINSEEYDVISGTSVRFIWILVEYLDPVVMFSLVAPIMAPMALGMGKESCDHPATAYILNFGHA